MVTGYTQAGCLHEALRLFQKMPERNVVSWNAMIAGYAQNGNFDEALRFFSRNAADRHEAELCNSCKRSTCLC